MLQEKELAEIREQIRVLLDARTAGTITHQDAARLVELLAQEDVILGDLRQQS